MSECRASMWQYQAVPAAEMPAWSIAVASRRCRLAGVTMAGFSDRATDNVQVALVPNPAFTLVFDLGDEPHVIVDSTGTPQRERIVAGLVPSAARGLVATESGCVDQSHLHRDVMAFAAATPAAVAVAPFLAVDDVALAAPKQVSGTYSR